MFLGYEVTEDQLEEILEVSGLIDDKNQDKLNDYITPDVRQRCEILKTIDPTEEKVDIIESFLFLVNNYVVED